MKWMFLAICVLLPVRIFAQGEFFDGRQSGYIAGVGATSNDGDMLYYTTAGYSWRGTVDLNLAVGKLILEGQNRTLGAAQIGLWPIRESKHFSPISLTCFASAQYRTAVSSYELGVAGVKRVPLPDSRVFLLPSAALSYQYSSWTSRGWTMSRNLWLASWALSVGLPLRHTSWLAVTGHYSRIYYGGSSSGHTFGATVSYVYGLLKKESRN